MSREEVHTTIRVPAEGCWGVDITCNYPKHAQANNWEFRAGPFTYDAGSENPFRFRGDPLKPRVRRIKVDLVLNSPGPSGEITTVDWIP